MSNLAPHRRFIDPGNMEGIPRVSVSTPPPHRDAPLPGTKSMLCPVDGSLVGLAESRILEKPIRSRTSTVLGIAALVFALVMPVWILFAHFGSERAVAWSIICGLAIVHLFAIFSQIISSCRNLPGALAIPVLYIGFIFWIVVDHLLA